MADLKVTKARFFAGTWEGVDSGAQDDPPNIDVSHLGKQVEFELTPSEDIVENWVLKIPVRANLLSDGVQVFLICEAETGEKLESFTIQTGEPLDDDFRAETELLRAELDMLKRAFRRHCLETAYASMRRQL